jgi:phosphoribosylformimino-5-aminoimidazole carboxamide ribotide isomerase
MSGMGPKSINRSCRRKEGKWLAIYGYLIIETLDMLAEHCSEFLIHAADVEGLCRGIDEDLVKCLGEWVTIPTTYAGGGKSLDDLALVNGLSKGRVDLTIGSALDIFGGAGVKLTDCVRWNNL